MVDEKDWRSLNPDHSPIKSNSSIHDPLDLILKREDGSNFEIRCRDIGISVERRLQRTVLRGGEGDDMSDEGSESAVYTVDAVIDLPQYRELIRIFRGNQPMMVEPYEGTDIKVAFRSISYQNRKKELKLVIIQDTN